MSAPEGAEPVTGVRVHADAMVASYVSGESLAVVGARYGVSGERARQVIARRSPDARALRALARERRVAAEEGARVADLVDRLRARAAETGEVVVLDTPELRAEFGVRPGDAARLRTLFPGVVLVKRPPRSGDRTYSDEDLLDAVREVSGALGREPASATEYDSVRDRARHPSVVTIAKRLGWSEALRRSGVSPDATRSRTRSDRVPAAVLAATLRVFLDSAPRTSVRAYASYAARVGAPSDTTVRNRFGTWVAAVAAALALAPGEAEAVLATETGAREDRELSEGEVAAVVADYASGLTPSAVASRHRVLASRVRDLVEEREPAALRAPAPVRVARGVTEESAVVAVREVAEEAGLDRLSVRSYETHRDPARHPSVSTIGRVSSWSAVLSRAGLSTPSTTEGAP